MDVCNNSCVDQMFAPEDKPKVPRREEKALREIIALVQPLVHSRGKAAKVDIGRDILVPAETCRWSEYYDLENLCEVFRVVLDQVGITILSTLAIYVSSFDPEDALSHFLGEIELLTNRLISAHCTSIIDAFRIGFTDELCDEPF
jgi:hypothetical protein